MNNTTDYFQKAATLNAVFKVKLIKIVLVYLVKTRRLLLVGTAFLVKAAQRNTRSCNCPQAGKSTTYTIEVDAHSR